MGYFSDYMEYLGLHRRLCRFALSFKVIFVATAHPAARKLPATFNRAWPTTQNPISSFCNFVQPFRTTRLLICISHSQGLNSSQPAQHLSTLPLVHSIVQSADENQNGNRLATRGRYRFHQLRKGHFQRPQGHSPVPCQSADQRIETCRRHRLLLQISRRRGCCQCNTLGYLGGHR